MRAPDWSTLDGSIRLYCGDALEVLPELEPASVRLLWTDPPYGHANQDGGDLQSARVRDQVKGGRVAPCEPIANDSAEEMRDVVDAALLWSEPLMMRDCCCCCCCCGGGGPKPTFAWTANRMDSGKLAFFHAVVWDKSDRGNGMGWRFRRNYEFVMVSHLRGGKLAWADDSVAVPNIMRIVPPRVRIHPNQKPTRLVQRFVDLTTIRGDMILDPFMGSGTTIVTAIRSGRKAIGIELDADHFATAVRRIEAELNRFPLLEEKPAVQRELLEATA